MRAGGRKAGRKEGTNERTKKGKNDGLNSKTHCFANLLMLNPQRVSKGFPGLHYQGIDNALFLKLGGKYSLLIFKPFVFRYHYTRLSFQATCIRISWALFKVEPHYGLNYVPQKYVC
jgi:hypothetical protein